MTEECANINTRIKKKKKPLNMEENNIDSFAEYLIYTSHDC